MFGMGEFYGENDYKDNNYLEATEYDSGWIHVLSKGFSESLDVFIFFGLLSEEKGLLKIKL